MNEITTVLRHATALIDKCGWQTGNEGNPVEGFCIIGAIGFAAQGNKALAVQAIEYVARVVGIPGGDANGVPSWNDKHASRKEVVLEAMNRAVRMSLAGADREAERRRQQQTHACACDSCMQTNGYAKVTSIEQTELTLDKEAIADAAELMANMPSLGVTFKSMWLEGKQVPVPGIDFPIIDPPKPKKIKSKVPKPQLADMLA